LLREDWQRQKTEYDDYDEEDEGYADDDFARSVAEEVAPFSRRQFPGLAQPEDHQLNTGQSERVLSGLGAARVGLVPASRPADERPKPRGVALSLDPPMTAMSSHAAFALKEPDGR
jgi:hypothetical protein